MSAADDVPAPDRPRVRPLEAFPLRERGERRFALRDPDGLIDGLVVVARPVLALLQLLDGTRTREEIRAAFAGATGEAIPRDDLDAVIKELSDALVLDGPAVEAARAAALAGYRGLLARPPACAGNSYPDDPNAC